MLQLTEIMSSEQELRRKRVYKFYLANSLEGKSFTYNHFKAEKIPKRTIYDIIKRAENHSGYQRVSGSGRIAKKTDKKNIKLLKVMFDHQDVVSQRQAARKFSCTKKCISKTLKTKTEIRVRNKKIIPKRTEDHQNKIRT